jgi:hypothetical protein
MLAICCARIAELIALRVPLGLKDVVDCLLAAIEGPTIISFGAE